MDQLTTEVPASVSNWQAVAIVLINMVGSVAMSWLRETTNRVAGRPAIHGDRPPVRRKRVLPAMRHVPAMVQPTAPQKLPAASAARRIRHR